MTIFAIILGFFWVSRSVTNKLLIPILTCQTDLNTYNKYITASFLPFCVSNIKTNKLLMILPSEFLKATWCWWWCSISTPTYTAPSDLRQLSGTMRHLTNDPLGKHYIIQSRDWLVHITNTSSEIRNSCASSIRPTGQYPRSNY